MHRIHHVAVVGHYRLELTFDDGVKGIVDLSGHVGKGVFEAWSDPEFFAEVRVGAYGELVWGEGIDLCPDALYLEVTDKQPSEEFPALNPEDVRA